MKSNGSSPRLKISADGAGVVSHAGFGMLREMAQHTGLVRGLNAALVDTYRGPWVHAPGRGRGPVRRTRRKLSADQLECAPLVESLAVQYAKLHLYSSAPMVWVRKGIMDRLWVLLEDEHPAINPKPGETATFSCSWRPCPATVPQEFCKKSTGLITEDIPLGQRIFSKFSSFEAVIDDRTADEARNLDGIASVDRYLWIDVDYYPSFDAKAIQRCTVCTLLKDFGSSNEAGSLIVVPNSKRPPNGYVILHRMVKVEVQ